jgi:hypothetical protein
VRLAAVLQRDEAQVGVEHAQVDGKIRIDHLPREDLPHVAPAPHRSVDGELAAGIVGRREKRQAGDMIPVVVAEEDARPHGPPRGEGYPERPQPGAQIEHDGLVAAANLDAGGIAARLARAFARRGKAAAHAPEAHHHRAVPARTRRGLLSRRGPGPRALLHSARLPKDPLCRKKVNVRA